MTTRWETFPVVSQGGLITNISPLRQGIESPGSARSLVNFEPSIEGGYKRVLGYSKYDSNHIPPYGEPKVQGSAQTGTTLLIANIHTSPEDGDTLTIAGVAGTYTIAGSGVSFNASENSATLTLTTSLDSSPADKAVITFGNNNDLIRGIAYFNGTVIAHRNSDIWKSSGSGWTKINKPSYGTVLVDGGAQTGTSLDIDGLTSAPRAGDTFSLAGVEFVYTVTVNATLTGDASTLTISPALDSSPADNAAVTWLSSERVTTNKQRHVVHTFNNIPTIVGVDGTNFPYKYDGTTFTVLTSVVNEVDNAGHVEEFKNHIFFAQDTELVFSAPYSDTDYTPANGAGAISFPYRITGLKVFREQLLVFCINQIYRVVGDSVSDFASQPISKDIGCTKRDTIQEVGGDIVFMGPDGIRFLSATDKIGDFGLAVASRPIQSEVNDFLDGNSLFSSCVVRGKNQYRVFGYKSSITNNSAQGILGTQFADQTAQGMAWSQLRGFPVYVVDSVYDGDVEYIVFGGRTGYVYRMEDSNGLDGEDIYAIYSTPFMPVNDPKIRKTIYTLSTYINPEGEVDGTATLKFDFNEPNLIQPAPVSISGNTYAASYYGSAIYGVSSYGQKLISNFQRQVIGSGFVVSVEYLFTGQTPPFSIDSLALEFKSHDRQ